MWGNEDYINNKRRDGINKYAAEKVLQSYGMLLEEYGTQLLRIQDTLCLPFNALNNHIVLKFQAQEETTVLNLIDTDNKVLNKMLIVFTTLCLEVQNLKKEGKNKYMNIIVYYGEGLEACNLLEGEGQLSMSKVLHVLQDLVGFVKRCSQVLLQIIQQMAAFYSYPWQNSKVVPTSDVHLKEVFDHVGELLLLLVTLDDVLSNHTALKDHFSLYQDTVQAAIRNPVKFSLDITKLKCLDKVLIEIDKKLLKNKIFQNILHLRYEKQVPVTKNTVFAEQMCFNIKAGCNDIETKYQTNTEVLTDWVKLCITYVLYLHLFGTTDKKLFKHIWELSKKFPCVNLYGNLMWFPDKFLFQHTSYMIKQIVDTKSQEAVHSSRLSYIAQTVQMLPKKVQMFTFQMFSWVVQIEACLHQELCNFKSGDLKNMCNLLLHGLQLSKKMYSVLNTFTNLHLALGKPMTKSSVLSLCRLVENIKSIEYMYNRHDATIAKAVQHMVQRLTYQALLIVSTVKKSLVQEKHFNEKQVDILSSLYIAEKTLYGPPTKTRTLIIRLALSMANRQKTFREDELDNLYTELVSLEIIANLKSHLQKVTNCDFLYWHRVILPIYFSRLYEAKTDLYRIRYILHAVHNVVANPDRASSLRTSLDQEISDYLSQKIIKQMCEEIETNLRLQTHSHLQTQKSTLQTINSSSKILILELIPLANKYLNIKGHLENYLEHTFYDLTTVALHNWRTYGEMRCLAQHKYNLETVEDTLPSQTLEQGLDVLEIMRNIHVFVSKYFYNLNNQIFIEHSTNNKHLRTINIRHIANSIRTHGTGIMSTTVNFTYQFLRKKLVIFSQFLYDEQIKSRLLKDLNYFRDNKTQLNSKYPYEIADRFNKGIRKLGVTSEGLTFLDQFRSLIVHIGNALGYVRMIRSGGLHFCADTISYIPDIDNIIPLEDLCIQEHLSSGCVDAAKSLDQAISNMSRNLTEGTEYFKLLVDVFSTVLQDNKNSHLRNFHIIIPPLTINFVEYLIISKEKMSKKSKAGAAFTDDGFAMGIAYLLKVLDLNNEFDSLHWFQTVKEKYTSEKNAIITQSKLEVREDDKLQQTLNLTAKRLNMYQKEFTLLYYSLSSARVLFQRDKTPIEGLIQK